MAELYELTHDKSLGRALERAKKTKYVKALNALLLPPADFIAMRLEHVSGRRPTLPTQP